MKITLVRSMARSAVFELVNSGCYRAPAPYTVSLDGATVCEGDTNVFSLYSLEPGRSYTLAVTLDGVTDTLDFTTAEESFFVDASRYGLVADGVTDNTAKLQAAAVHLPRGRHGLRARRHLPHPKPVFAEQHDAVSRKGLHAAGRHQPH